MSTITASNNNASKFMTHVACVLIAFVGLASAFAIILPSAQWTALTLYYILPVPLGASVTLALWVAEITTTSRQALKLSAYCSLAIVACATIAMLVPTNSPF